MTILIVNSLYPPDIIGGAEVSTYKLAKELARRNHDVHVLSTGTVDSDEEMDGVIIHRRRFKNIQSFWDFKHSTPVKRVLWKLIDYYNVLNKKIIRTVIDQVNPEVIHANTIYGISPVLWKVAKEKNIPVVQTLRDYYLMCPKANLMKKNGNKCDEPRFICKMFRNLYRHDSDKVDVVTAPSQYTLNQFLDADYFKSSQKKVIYNAIDYDEQEIREVINEREERANHDSLNIIYVGSFLETKGINVLLEAIKMAPNNIVFHFAGKGKLQSKIEAQAEESKNIVLHGFLNENELNALLKEMDCLVCPSIWAEPFGRVVIDAYKVGLPVIVTDCGGLPELVENEVTGLIVKRNSVSSLLEAFQRVAGGYCFNIDAIVASLERFSLSRQTDLFLKLYSEIIG